MIDKAAGYLVAGLVYAVAFVVGFGLIVAGFATALQGCWNQSAAHLEHVGRLGWKESFAWICLYGVLRLIAKPVNTVARAKNTGI